MTKLAAVIAPLLLVTGCTSSFFVEDLSTSSQISLCEQFLDDVCSTPLGAGFCDDPCIDSGCGPAAENGDIDFECGGVLDVEVEDCGFTGDPDLCTSTGGECMFDALETACS